ncbi:MAG: hypothetical protein JNK02_11010 [Planctomycetes bacterium]|nr:hypothetical protein [Planctomycetota bacterium]
MKHRLVIIILSAFLFGLLAYVASFGVQSEGASGMGLHPGPGDQTQATPAVSGWKGDSLTESRSRDRFGPTPDVGSGQVTAGGEPDPDQESVEERRWANLQRLRDRLGRSEPGSPAERLAARQLAVQAMMVVREVAGDFRDGHGAPLRTPPLESDVFMSYNGGREFRWSRNEFPGLAAMEDEMSSESLASELPPQGPALPYREIAMDLFDRATVARSGSKPR